MFENIMVKHFLDQIAKFKSEAEEDLYNGGPEIKILKSNSQIIDQFINNFSAQVRDNLKLLIYITKEVDVLYPKSDLYKSAVAQEARSTLLRDLPEHSSKLFLKELTAQFDLALAKADENEFKLLKLVCEAMRGRNALFQGEVIEEQVDYLTKLIVDLADVNGLISICRDGSLGTYLVNPIKNYANEFSLTCALAFSGISHTIVEPRPEEPMPSGDIIGASNASLAEGE